MDQQEIDMKSPRARQKSVKSPANIRHEDEIATSSAKAWQKSGKHSARDEIATSSAKDRQKSGKPSARDEIATSSAKDRQKSRQQFGTRRDRYELGKRSARDHAKKDRSEIVQQSLQSSPEDRLLSPQPSSLWRSSSKTEGGFLLQDEWQFPSPFHRRNISRAKGKIRLAKSTGVGGEKRAALQKTAGPPPIPGRN